MKDNLAPTETANWKGHTLDIAPLCEESSVQKRSGVARVVERFHSFTCTSTRLSTSRMNHTCLCLPSQSWSLFTDPGGMEGRVGLDTSMLRKRSAEDRYMSRGLTSHSTLYRSFRGRYQQRQSTEGSQLATEIGFSPTRTTPLCYNMNCRQPPLG